MRLTLLTMHYLILVDASAILLFAVLASLSRRLGQALKTPPIYRGFYISIALVSIAGLEAILAASGMRTSSDAWTLLPMLLRCVGALIAVITALKYWQWLFGEFFTHKR